MVVDCVALVSVDPAEQSELAAFVAAAVSLTAAAVALSVIAV